MKRDILFIVSKSDHRVDYPHFEQISMHFWFPNACILVILAE